MGGNESLSVVQVVGNVAVGGAERHVFDLVQGLCNLGACVRVVCPRVGPLSDRLVRHGIQVSLLEMVHPLPGDEYAADYGVVEQLVAWFTQWKPHVVHSHLYPAHLHASQAAARAGVPAIVQTAHTLVVRPGDVLLERLTNVRTIATARSLVDRLAASGLSRDRIQVIYNGVDCEPPLADDGRFESIRSALGLERGPVIGTVARLSHEKGVDVLLEALPYVLECFPSLTALVVGDGPERENLLQLSANLGLTDNVRFLGTRQDISKIQQALDVFVLASRQEACSMALLEAMGAGRAVVATCVGGSPELIDDGMDGVLVPADEPVALATAITGLARDAARRQSLGANAQAKISRWFTRERMVRETHALYLRVLSTEY